MNGRILVLAFLAPACSSSPPASSPEPGGTDASVEAGPADAGADSGSEGCGAPPYVNVSLVVRSASASGADGAPIEGAKLTASICPEAPRLSGPDGTITAAVSKGVPFYARFEAPNYAATLIAELHLDADKSGIVAPLPPQLFTALIPGFGPDKTALVAAVMKDGGTGACDQLDGVTIEVQDHPEAVVTYFTNDAVPQPTTGTTTTAGGRAVITQLAPSQLVTLRASKAGCTVSFTKDPYTGRAPLAAGTVTLAPAYIH
jgi:hypothetical protein